MINLLATGLISLCLLSPTQPTSCVGDIGLPAPLPSISLPGPILPAPLPPVLPVQPVPAPIPAPAPPVVIPAPAPVQLRPIPAPAAPAPVPLPPDSAPIQPPAPEAPAPPEPTVEPKIPEPTDTATEAPTAAPTPSPQPTKPRFRLPLFNDGSAGSQIVDKALQYPDVVTLLMTGIIGLGLILLNQKLDTRPEPKRSSRHTKPKTTDS